MNKIKQIKIHPSLNFAEDLKQICKPLQLLNIAYFAHVHIDNKNRFSALGLQPEFVKLYLDKEYYRYDIHMAQSQQKESYIIWDNFERVKESQELYDDFMHFNIGHTFTICQKYKDYADYFHFSAKLGQSYMNQYYLSQLHHIKQFIYYFRDKINSNKELRQAYQLKFSIPPYESGYFTLDGNDIILPATYNQAIATNRIFIAQDTYLTKRELQCLHYLALGKKRHEIAQIMSVSPRTIKAHIQNIKSKLNCENQFQLGLKYSEIQLPEE